MPKTRWKPREVRRAILNLSFTELPKRGKGGHRMYFKDAVCRDGMITIKTQIPFGKRELHPKTRDEILNSLATDLDTFTKAFRKEYTASDYESYLLTLPRSKLLPRTLRS